MNISIYYPAKSYSNYCKEKGTLYVEEQLHIIRKIFNFENCPPIRSSKYDDFMDLINSPNNDVLLGWRGGKVEEKTKDESNSSIQLVKSLKQKDFDTIRSSNKKIVGLSDISFLLCSLLSNDIKCYYGPNLCAFIEGNNEERRITYQYLEQVLLNNTLSINLMSQDLNPEYNNPWIISDGIAKGRISGGNIDTISQIDTEESGIKENDILFLEENDPYYYSVNDVRNPDSLFNKLSKIISEAPPIKGLIIGKSNIPRIFDTERDILELNATNNQEKEYLVDVVKRIGLNNIPIIANVSCGHKLPSFTIPLGEKMCLDTYKGLLYRI